MGSDHALAMQQANERTVLGDFRKATFAKDGVTSTFFQRDGSFFVRTDGPDGRLSEFKIAYTFGVDPLQQYLIEFPKGRFQALSIAWDTRLAEHGGQRWFHLYPKERIDHRDILHWAGPLQNWNFMCADCHSTNLQKNYRAAEERFETSWSEINVSCEACHGPGSRHVAWAREFAAGRASQDASRGLEVLLKDPAAGKWVIPPGKANAALTKPRSSNAQVETCARCHARAARIWGPHEYGQPLAQTHRIALLEERLYHADGQILEEVYEYGSFLQSKMFRSGVTCSDCHDPHSGRLRLAGNATCAPCHLASKYDAPQHHFHRAGTPGAQCASCHMAKRLYMVVDGRRDHSFRVPRPDLSVKLGVPNACNDCHISRSPRWAADAVARLYGPSRRQEWHFAEALHAGRNFRPNAEAQLLRAVQDKTQPSIARATALDLLRTFLTPKSLAAVETSARDEDPLVRRAAASALPSIEPRLRSFIGAPLLSDTVRSVRLEALAALLETPRETFAAGQLPALDRAIAEYRAAQEFNADRAEAHMNMGALEAHLGNAAEGEAAYRRAMRMQPAFIAPYVNLADLYRQQAREQDAERVLREAIAADPGSGDARYGLGLSLVRQKRLREAIPQFERAAQLRPDLPRYAYAYAVALHDAQQALRALDVLAEAQARFPADREILVALAEFSFAAGNRKAAAVWARKLVELTPDDPSAQEFLRRMGRDR
jgi:tetratricopeptide (TPR) repeat protein